MVQTSRWAYASLQITHLQDFGTEKNGGGAVWGGGWVVDYSRVCLYSEFHCDCKSCMCMPNRLNNLEPITSHKEIDGADQSDYSWLPLSQLICSMAHRSFSNTGHFGMLNKPRLLFQSLRKLISRKEELSHSLKLVRARRLQSCDHSEYWCIPSYSRHNAGSTYGTSNVYSGNHELGMLMYGRKKTTDQTR